MHLTLWAFAPLVAAPLASLILIGLLRWTLTPVKSDDGTAAERWNAIKAHLHPMVTRLLPVPVGAAVTVLVAWPFAYLGWYVVYLSDDPTAMKVFPPWFGNPGYILMFGVAGVVIALMAAVMVAAVVIATYYIGKCTIWPDTCGCDDGDDDRDDTCASTPEEPV